MHTLTANTFTLTFSFTYCSDKGDKCKTYTVHCLPVVFWVCGVKMRLRTP